MANVNAESGRRGNWRYMYGTHAWFPETQNDWSAGMVRDRPRNAIPPNGAYDIADYLVHQPGALIGRGGTSYYAFGADMTGATYAQAVYYFQQLGSVVAIGDNGHFFTSSGGSWNDKGAGTTVSTVDTPKLRVGGGKNLLIFANSDGTTSPATINSAGTVAALGGSPPAGKYAAVYKSRLALGGNSANPNRVFFSPTPDIESTWDTTNSWIDFDNAVTGMAAVQNALLVFSLSKTERLTGDTPPPGSNMDRQPVGAIGCLDARSIVVYENNVIFANQKGVYITNGVALEPLTVKKDGTGISHYWQSIMGNYTSSYIISAGIIRDYLLVFVVNGSGTLITGLYCYLPTRAWGRLTNIIPTMFGASSGGTDELYVADRSTNKVQKLAGMIVNADSKPGISQDANLTAVTPLLETRAFGAGFEEKAFGDVYVTADLQNSLGSTNPSLAVTYSAGQIPGSYSAATDSPFPCVAYNTSNPTRRRRFGTGVDAQAMSLKITQSASSGQTVIRGIEVNSRMYPQATDGP